MHKAFPPQEVLISKTKVFLSFFLLLSLYQGEGELVEVVISWEIVGQFRKKGG